jgi:hypothetical protein
MHGNAKENMDDFFFYLKNLYHSSIGQSRWHHKMESRSINALNGCGSHVSLKTIE